MNSDENPWQKEYEFYEPYVTQTEDYNAWEQSLQQNCNDQRTKIAEKRSSKRSPQYLETIKWINENYEFSEGQSLPRCTIYHHYLDYCNKRRFNPAGAAAFGKMVRQTFLGLTTRRLGTRGQSKYHYYGITIKENSIYFKQNDCIVNKIGLTRFSAVHDTSKSKTSGKKIDHTLKPALTEFPNAEDLSLPQNVNLDQIHTFLIMYRTHSERMLDIVGTGSFQEVRRFLHHFWQGVPQHLPDVLSTPFLADLTAVCDNILYNAMEEILVPSYLPDLPEPIRSAVEQLCKEFPEWVDDAMSGLPDILRHRKILVVNGFVQRVRRELQFLYLSQACAQLLTSSDKLKQIIQDLSRLKLADVCDRVLCLDQSFKPESYVQLETYFQDFLVLLRKEPGIKEIFQWMDTILTTACLNSIKSEKWSDKTESCGVFLLEWFYFLSLLTRDLVLRNAPAFGYCQLLRLLLEEYALLAVQLQLEDAERRSSAQRLMRCG